MIRWLLIGLIGMVGGTSLAQPAWIPAGLPGTAMNIRQVISNEDNTEIYLAGAIDLGLEGGWFYNNAVMRYSEGQWDTLGVIRGHIHTIALYHDTLFAGGHFNECDGIPCEKIAYYDGEAWLPYGSFDASVRKLRVLNGELYAVGSFEMADGQPATGVAKRIGNTWEPVGLIDSQYTITVTDITLYNGELIASGGIPMEIGDDIVRYDGDAWHLLGQGIQGGFSGPQCLAVYNGDLYVGGQIDLPSGNAGQNIMRWDGQQFHPLGDGLQQHIGDLVSIATAWTMEVHNGLLFVGGGFRGAGGVPANSLATWDGEQWCAVPMQLDTPLSHVFWGIAFYQDTLFAACGPELEGEDMNLAAKYVGDLYGGVCNSTLNVAERDGPSRNVLNFTYLNNDQYILTGLPDGSHRIRLFDVRGAQLWEQRLVSGGQRSAPFDVRALVPGIYFCQVEDVGIVKLVRQP